MIVTDFIYDLLCIFSYISYVDVFLYPLIAMFFLVTVPHVVRAFLR